MAFLDEVAPGGGHDDAGSQARARDSPDVRAREVAGGVHPVPLAPVFEAGGENDDESRIATRADERDDSRIAGPKAPLRRIHAHRRGTALDGCIDGAFPPGP